MGAQTPAIRGEIVTTEATANPAMIYLATLRSARSRDVMRRKLDNLAAQFGHTWDTMPWHELTFAHVEAIVTKELERTSPATVNGLLSAVKGVLRACWHLGLIDAESYYKIKDVQGVRGGASDPAGRYVTIGGREALIRACDDGTDAGQRDAAILLLLCACGLRRAEVPTLDFEDISADDTESEMMTLQVRGKGRKKRAVYLNDGARDAMFDWLDVRGNGPGPLFYSGRKGGRLNVGQRMSHQAIYDLLKKRARLAGVKALTPHDLRRSWISDLLDAGVDISTVAGLAGHSDVSTTQRYDRRGERARKKAARTLHFAYRRRGA